MSFQRGRVGKRVARERARNTRLALVGVLGMGVLISAGLHSGLGPPRIPGPPSAAEAQRQEFAATRTGHIRLLAIDSGICREMQFNNETGRFSSGRLVRCDADAAAVVEAPQLSPEERAATIRDGFTSR